MNSRIFQMNSVLASPNQNQNNTHPQGILLSENQPVPSNLTFRTQSNLLTRTALSFLRSLPDYNPNMFEDNLNYSINLPSNIDNFVETSSEVALELIQIRSRLELVFSLTLKGDDIKLKKIILELYTGVLHSHLSRNQFNILLDKIDGMTYKNLRAKYNLSSDTVLSRVLKRTACGRYWEKGVSKGGRNKILSDLDLEEFVQVIRERENDINCISTCEARKVALYLQAQRVSKAQAILIKCGCHDLASKLKIRDPDPSWLLKMSNQLGLSIVQSDELERMRRIACDKTAIDEFFSKNSHLLQRDKRLIFNMDETMASAKKKFKVLVTKNHRPLTVSPQKLPHITACVTIGATGYVMKPLYILPKKKTLKGLEIFNGIAYFASSSSGWMNKNLFTYWGLLFIAEMSIYRLGLPPDLREQRILLLLDGHKSRNNYFIARVFDSFNIDVLIFPGHTSHLLQAFDVAIASPLKSAYKRWLLLYDLDLNNLFVALNPKKEMGEIRIMMISCLNNAISDSATLGNIQSGFRASGIHPLNKDAPLQSRFAMDNSMRERFPDLYKKIKNGNLINNHHLNGNHENLAYVFHAEFGRMPLEEELKMGIEDIKAKVQSLHQCSVDAGKMLTPIPDLLIEQNGSITRIKLDQ